MKLGRITSVDVRTIWTNEASNFTPWRAIRGGKVEVQLAVIYRLDGVLAASDALQDAYSRTEVRLRQAARVGRQRERPGQSSHIDADPGA